LKPPTREEALRLMREAGCSQQVIDHCLRVTKVAMNLTDMFRQRGFEVDLALVEAGALMHDLGRSKTHSVEHGVVGGQLAREMGLPDSLVRVIERHVGAGITADEAERIGLPKGSYMPETLEEQIVAYADARELGKDHPALDRLRALHDEIVSLIGPEFRPDIDLNLLHQ